MSYARANLRITNEKQKKNSHEGITWSEMGKQNVQAEKVYFLNTMNNLRMNPRLTAFCFSLESAEKYSRQSLRNTII